MSHIDVAEVSDLTALSEAFAKTEIAEQLRRIYHCLRSGDIWSERGELSTYLMFHMLNLPAGSPGYAFSRGVANFPSVMTRKEQVKRELRTLAAITLLVNPHKTFGAPY